MPWHRTGRCAHQGGQQLRAAVVEVRRPQLLSAMVGSALAEMPRHEGVLRGSATSPEGAAEAAAEAAWRATAETAAATALDAVAQTGGQTTDTVLGTIFNQMLAQAGFAAVGHE